MSIRRQLILWLLTSVLAAGLLASAVVFFQARAEANGLFDYQLRQIAIALRDRKFLPGQLDEVLQGEDAREVVVQVWAPDGTRIYTSDANAAAPGVIRLGFDDMESVNGSWRVFGIQQRGLTFQVAQPMSVRDDLALAAAKRTLLPFLVALPLMGLLIWTLVGREFRPLDATAKAVSRRNPDSLEPVESAGVPDEVRPLIASLNDLLSRLGDTLALQRQFVADAAHELRTPLTALRLQLQLAERASGDDERIQAHDALREGIARAAHLVEQLLVLARMDPGTPASEATNVDLADIASRVVRNHEVLAAARSVTLDFRHEAPVIVAGDASGLQMLADNLLSNALRHSPAGGYGHRQRRRKRTASPASRSRTRGRASRRRSASACSPASIAAKPRPKAAAGSDSPSSGAWPSVTAGMFASPKPGSGTGLRAIVSLPLRARSP